MTLSKIGACSIAIALATPLSLAVAGPAGPAQQAQNPRELARATSLRAIELASTAHRLFDARFARSRRNAYFNLFHLAESNDEGGAVPTPSAQPASTAAHAAESSTEIAVATGEQVCWEPAPELGCSKTFFACETSWTSSGRSASVANTRIRLARTSAAARFDDDELRSTPEVELPAAASDPLPYELEATAHLDFLAVDTLESKASACAEWSCDGSAAVARATAHCEEKAGADAAARAACAASTCSRAERAPWPAVKKEQRDADACPRELEAMESDRRCRLVYANACTGLVGIACANAEGGKAPTTRVAEFRFESP